MWRRQEDDRSDRLNDILILWITLAENVCFLDHKSTHRMRNEHDRGLAIIRGELRELWWEMFGKDFR